MVGKVSVMDLVIIGAGGFGREVLDVAREMDLHGSTAGRRVDVLGFIDDDPDLDRLGRIKAEHLGGVSTLPEYAGASFVVGVGDPVVRERLAAAAAASGLTPAHRLLHPSASIGDDVKIGAGSIICAGVRVTTNVRIGTHVHLNLNATVGHDAVVEDYVTVNPLAAVSGDVLLRRGSMVGTTACVNQGLEVGTGAIVGAGAAVIRDVTAGRTVVGVPARERGQVITRG